tara:strand:- start:203 stop:709 length:507 start_codon:yes stop_codon:yes gene_type:complete
METKNLQQAMEEYLDRIAEIMVNELFENGSVVSGALAKSIQDDNDVIEKQDGSVIGELSMFDYGQSVDEGFRFRGTGGLPPERPIRDWISRKRINRPQKFKDDRSWIWAIRMSIGRKINNRTQKTKPYPFIEKSFKAAEKFGIELLTLAGGKDITEQLNIAFTDSTKI